MNVWVVVNTKLNKVLDVVTSEEEAGNVCHYLSKEIIKSNDTPKQIIDKCMTYMYEGPFDVYSEERKEIR